SPWPYGGYYYSWWWWGWGWGVYYPGPCYYLSDYLIWGPYFRYHDRYAEGYDSGYAQGRADTQQALSQQEKDQVAKARQQEDPQLKKDFAEQIHEDLSAAKGGADVS